MEGAIRLLGLLCADTCTFHEAHYAGACEDACALSLVPSTHVLPVGAGISSAALTRWVVKDCTARQRALAALAMTTWPRHAAHLCGALVWGGRREDGAGDRRNRSNPRVPSSSQGAGRGLPGHLIAAFLAPA